MKGRTDRLFYHPGAQVRRARRALDYTLQDVADETGLPVHTVHNFERARGQGINITVLAILCKVLSLSWVDVLNEWLRLNYPDGRED